MSVARQARLWQWAGVAYGVVAVAFIAWFPSVVLGGRPVSMIQLFGPSMLVPVSVPLVVMAAAALVPWRPALVAWVVTGGLTVFLLATAFSFGLLYLPCAAFTALAAYLHGRAPVEDAPLPPDDWTGITARKGPRP